MNKTDHGRTGGTNFYARIRYIVSTPGRGAIE
jgi:hypothetical protein